MAGLRALGDYDGYIKIVHRDTALTSVCCFFGVGFRFLCGFTRVYFKYFKVGLGFL